MKSLPVIVGFEGAVLVEAHVLGLLVSQLCQVGVKDGQVQTGHVLIWGTQGEIHTVWMTVPSELVTVDAWRKKLTHLLGQEIHVLLVPAHWCIEELNQGQGLQSREWRRNRRQENSYSQRGNYTTYLSCSSDGQHKRRHCGAAQIEEATLRDESTGVKCAEGSKQGLKLQNVTVQILIFHLGYE